MAEVLLSVEEWAEQQFGGCQLGDQRRTRRLVKFAAQIANDSSSSTPRQTASWYECKAAYRLIGCDQTTHASVGTPHWKETRARDSGEWLLLGDTTELDFGIHRQVSGLGPTGNGDGRGFFLHSSLLVGAETEEIVGLAAQDLFHRQECDPAESRYDRLLRTRESEVWGRVIDEVGSPRANVRWTHVFDRGADNFEVFMHLVLQRCDWVVRIAQLARDIITPRGKHQKLERYVRKLPECGRYELPVRAQKDQPARTATVAVRLGLVTVPAPKQRTPWMKTCGIAAITMWVVEVREIAPPNGAEPLRWVLYTSHPITTFEEALRVIRYYEKRWLIEEYHKALKSGCRLEDRQYTTSARLEAITGVLAIVAVRLLQLKAVARSQPNLPASKVVPLSWIKVLQTLRHRTGKTWTVRQFFRELAGLGGFLGRTRDGEPGWITIWRGFDKLVPALVYAERSQRRG